MKTIHIIKTSVAVALLAFYGTAAAQQLPGKNVNILNKKVSKLGNTVNIDMDFQLDNLKLKSNKGLVFTPMIVNSDDTLKMPAIEVMGRKRYIYYQRNHLAATPAPLLVERRRNGDIQGIHYSYQTPYKSWMSNSQLVIGQDLCGCNQMIVENGLLSPVGEALAGPVKLQYAYVQPKAEAIKARKENGTARLQFNINKASINTNLGNNHAELDKMRKTIDLVKNDQDVHITSITLHGYASPDGSYANNEKLAESRTKAVFDYLNGQYPLQAKLFQISSTAEDWQGVHNYVENHTIPQKEIVQNIINSNMQPDEKERAIAMKAGDAHRYLINNVYPSLRRTEYTINYEVRDFNLDEARKIIKERPQKLSLKEMYAVANSYQKGCKDYNEVFDIAVLMFPNDELANLNAANTALAQGDKAKAEKLLKKAGNRPEAVNARGALFILKEDYQNAKTYFEKAAKAGLEEAKQNLKRIFP